MSPLLVIVGAVAGILLLVAGIGLILLEVQSRR